MNWNDSYRKLFFDYHNFADNHSIAKDFDAVKFADRLEEVGCQTVSVFAMGGKGHRYFRKGQYGVVHPNLPEGVDMVEDVVRECHNRNIQVVGYVAYSVNGDFLKEKYPHFIQREADGAYRDIGFSKYPLCLIGAGNDYLLNIYRELCENYELDYFFLDGSYNNDNLVCYCDNCKKTFKEKSGFDIPTTREDANWNVYIDWYQREMCRFRDQVIDAVKKAREGIEVIINWNYTYRSPDIIPENLDYLFADVPFKNEFEGIDITTRSFALTGKKFEIHNTAFLKHWGEWGAKHPNVLKRAAALLLANGTNVHMGYQFHPKFHVDNGVWQIFKEVFDFVKPLEKLLQGNQTLPFIGGYFANVQSGLTHTGDIWSEPMWLYGFNKMMIDAGLHYNMLPAQMMRETINKFSAVILPDMRYISTEQIEILQDYVKEGGVLIATGLSGTMDEMGNKTNSSVLCDLFGFEWHGEFDHPYSYLKVSDNDLAKNTADMPLTMEAPTALIKATSAKSLASIYDLYQREGGGYALVYSPYEGDTGYSGVTLRELGKGKAIFFANEIALAYYKTFQWNIIEMIKNVLFDIAKVEKKVYATGDGSIELTLARKGEATQVHMVNMLGTQPNVQETVGFCMPREIMELCNIPVTALHHTAPTKVTNVTRGEDIPFVANGNRADFKVPAVGLYEIIEII